MEPSDTEGATMNRISLTDYAASIDSHSYGHRAALASAEASGLTIGHYATDLEAAREGITVDEAADIAAEDASLVWVGSADAYKLDLAHLTVLRTDEDGEVFDLNADGEPCTTMDDLRTFIVELCTQGFYNAATRDALLDEAE
jgi:hypothetical protein